MTEADIPKLKANYGRMVRLHLKDGEIVEGKVMFVSESEGDVVLDLVSSNRISDPVYVRASPNAVFLYTFANIDRVEELPL